MLSYRVASLADVMVAIDCAAEKEQPISKAVAVVASLLKVDRMDDSVKDAVGGRHTGPPNYT